MPSMQQLVSPTALEIFHTGPELKKGPLPAVFYFALSGKESLGVDPYNRPIQAWASDEMHCFSLTLPGHRSPETNSEMMAVWARELAKDTQYFYKFIAHVIESIDYLIEQGYVNGERIAAAGLSRGSFIAAHVAAQDTRIRSILGFAPLTRLDFLSEFDSIRSEPAVQNLSLVNIAHKLTERRLRFYVSNRDERVGTDACYQFIKRTADIAYEKRVRPSMAELIVFPAIGHKGHGTPPEIFKDGANWLRKCLC